MSNGWIPIPLSSLAFALQLATIESDLAASVERLFPDPPTSPHDDAPTRLLVDALSRAAGSRVSGGPAELV